MNLMPLNQWISITATSNMPLYAILSNTGESQALKEYYRHDGTETPYGLYSGTPYSDWFQVMPRMVRLSDNSPFLNWITSTDYKDWGWLARSPFPLDVITPHIKGLTQVRMPDGKDVFFRYWDGEYMSEHLKFMGNDWCHVLPVFPFYWMNGEYFTIQIPAQVEPQTSPWWQVPQGLINSILQKNNKPILGNILQIIREDYPELYWQFDEAILNLKIKRAIKVSGPELNQVINTVLTDLKQAF